MSKFLQVLHEEEEILETQGVARRLGVTLAVWVRRALRKARGNRPEVMEAKLRAIADASRHQFPTADIDIMLREIEVGNVASDFHRLQRAHVPGGRSTSQ